MAENIAQRLAKKLKRKKLTISVAESCTGGLVSKKLTDIPGSSAYFKLGMIVYSNEVKIRDLKVPKKSIEEFGAVSGIVAHQMARQIQKKAKTDIGVGVTGIAGPSGGTKDKPVGLVYMSVVSAKNSETEYKIFKGTRESVRKKAVEHVLSLVWNIC